VEEISTKNNRLHHDALVRVRSTVSTGLFGCRLV